MEDNNKYNLNEKSKARSTLRVLGPVVLVLGIALIIYGISNMFNGSNAGFIGIPLTFVGSVMTLFGYMGSLARYSASQSVPVAKDVTNYMLDGTKESIGLVAGEISKNLHQTQNQKSSIKYCSACHEELADEARFCDHCGVPLFKKCTKCNKENDIDAIYCQDCGAKLEV